MNGCVKTIDQTKAFRFNLQNRDFLQLDCVGGAVPNQHCWVDCEKNIAGLHGSNNDFVSSIIVIIIFITMMFLFSTTIIIISIITIIMIIIMMIIISSSIMNISIAIIIAALLYPLLPAAGFPSNGRHRARLGSPLEKQW